MTRTKRLYKVTVDNVLGQYFPLTRDVTWEEVKDKPLDELVDSGLLEVDYSELPNNLNLIVYELSNSREVAFVVDGMNYTQSVYFLSLYRDRHKYKSMLSSMVYELAYYLELLGDDLILEKETVLLGMSHSAKRLIEIIKDILSERPE